MSSTPRLTDEQQLKLLEAEREQRLFAETLTDVTLALTSQMEPTAVLNEILRQARRLVPYRTAHIVLLEGNDLRIACWQGYETFGSEQAIAHLVQPLTEFPLDAEVVRSKTPLLIGDTHNEPRWVVQEKTRWVRSHVVYPIALGNTVLGLLRLDGDEPNAFSEKTITYLRPLMNAAAIALENARLYSQAQKEIAERAEIESQLKENVQQLELAFRQTKVYAEELRGEVLERKKAEEQIRQRNRELTLLNRIISTTARGLREEAILDIVCREMALAFDTSDAFSFLFDETGETAQVVAVCLANNRPPLLETTLSVDDYPTLRLLIDGKVPVISNNIAADARFRDDPLIAARGIEAAILIPLVIDDAVVGCLSLWHNEPRTFTAPEIDLSWRAAEQVSMAIARARLDEQRRQLSAAIEQSTESVVIADAGGNIVYTNPAFEQITGYAAADVLGKSLIDLLRSDKHPPILYAEIWKRLQAGSGWQGRLTVPKKDGSTFTGDTAITPIRNRRGEVVNYISSQRDVTRELQLEAQYYQAEKMHAIGRLTSGIAHDFNNLLTAINGFAEVLQGHIPEDDPRREFADRIRHTGQRASDLVDRLLSFSRKQESNPQVVDLNAVITDISKMLDPILGSHIILKTRFAGNLWRVKIDPTQLEQIVVNLAVNARDAMPDGGRLEIRTGNMRLDGHQMGITQGKSGEYVVLTVSDTGMGMPDDVKAHIFEPFFTTKEKGKGSGLGLATIFSIVQQQNGFIEVDSELGKGTTFRIYLPRTTDTVTAPRRKVQADELPRGSETVLVVEDEPAVRNLAVRLLARYGYTVLEATDGEAALTVVDEYPDEIHLLISDMIMPEIGGEELAKRLKTHFPALKVLLMSGKTGKSAETKPAGVNGFIRKPFSAFELVRRVREILDNGTGVTP